MFMYRSVSPLFGHFPNHKFLGDARAASPSISIAPCAQQYLWWANKWMRTWNNFPIWKQVVFPWPLDSEKTNKVVWSTEKHMETHCCFPLRNIWNNGGLAKSGWQHTETKKLRIMQQVHGLFNGLTGSLDSFVPKILLTSGVAFSEWCFLKNKSHRISKKTNYI